MKKQEQNERKEENLSLIMKEFKTWNDVGVENLRQNK